MAQEHIEYYKDGGVKSKGHIADGGMDGYWEWFRKNHNAVGALQKWRAGW
jgi:hypothetical protein